MAKHNFVSDIVKEQHLDFLAIMETDRSDFPASTLRHLCSGLDFMWHIMPPRGRSGGMILGVNATVFDIGSIIEGDFYCKFLVKNKEDGFTWALYAVYGPAQDEFKQVLLTEMAHVCSMEVSHANRGRFLIS